METSIKHTSIAVVLMLLAVSMRIVPHPANFAPIAAIALFAGAVLPRRIAVITPLAAMVMSDLVLGLHHLVLVTWGVYALIALASSQWLRRPTLLGGGLLTVGSSLLFFIVSNFGVWVEGELYPRTIHGLVQCYAMALPFFHPTLLSDLLFTGCLFWLYNLATKRTTQLQKLRTS